MTSRRSFIKKSTFGAASLYLSPYQEYLTELKKVKKIGIQLFSLPKSLSTDFVGSVKMLAQMGYKELEFFGPYSFSAPAAIEGWKGAAKMLGFDGSGYYGKTPKEVKMLLDDHGLTAPTAHTDFETLMNHMDKLGEAASVVGHKYVVLPAIPDDKRKTLDDYKRTAEAFNKIGEKAKKAGVKFAYHNHGYGFKPMDGEIPFNLLMAQTDPNLVFLEMDIFWTSAAGVDPIAYLDKFGKRYHLLHLKDMKVKKTFSGDGGNMGQWMELFPNMTTAGDGVMDLKGIIKKAQSIGIKHYLVEQDMVAQPEIALKKSIDFLKTV